MRTIPAPKEEILDKNPKHVWHPFKNNGPTLAAIVSRNHILENFPVKSKEQFTKEELHELTEMYRVKEPKVHGLDTILTFGTHSNHTLREVLHKNPAWLVWALKQYPKFVVQDAVMGALQMRLDEMKANTQLRMESTYGS
jgi:hypothetical protein